jgi:predicted alpha/beta superfamily hydrolase
MTPLDEAPAIATTDAPVSPPGCVQFDLASNIAGRTYRVFVYQPLVPPPPEGYPVITVTDGNMNFLLAMVMAGMFAFQAKPAVIVGVGYPTSAPFDLMRLRVRDMTPDLPLASQPLSPGLPEPTPENYGGAELFRRFLVEELRPVIAGRWPVDPDDQTLYGYSLGGLFTLVVLFADPRPSRPSSPRARRSGGTTAPCWRAKPSSPAASRRARSRHACWSPSASMSRTRQKSRRPA